MPRSWRKARMLCLVVRLLLLLLLLRVRVAGCCRTRVLRIVRCGCRWSRRLLLQLRIILLLLRIIRRRR